MQPRVTAILVARNGAESIERTLEALAASTRRPDGLVVIDDASADDSAALATRFAPTGAVRIDSPKAFGAAVAHGLHVVGGSALEDDWLWLLGHDNAPEPAALAALVSAVEVAPSVAVAGPKLMRASDPDVIADFGTTVTYYGATIRLVSGELDQAQYDRESDVLAVAAAGMLVRRTVWDELGGFDPALPSIDAALDFCVRVRLAGHRIVGVPSARVESALEPQDFVREASRTHTDRVARSAQLHRRLTWAPAPAVPLHWLSFVPLAFGRSIGHLLGKRPGSIAGEFRAALGALVDGGVAPARRNLARGRRLGWRAIAPLRMPPREVRRLRAHQRDLAASPVLDSTLRVRASFFAAGGAWVILALLAIGAVSALPLYGAAAVAGGGLAPLSATIGELWSHVGWGVHAIGTAHDATGFVGASDPFAAVLALLGSLTFWAPSTSVVILYVIAIPLAGLGGWWAASRFSDRGWAPALGAIAWGLAPPLLSGLSTGHLGAVIAHLLLPWLVLALFGAPRSWSSSATAAILFAAIAASSPSLIPVLLVGWLLACTRGAGRTVTVPIPALLLFAPFVVEVVARGQWWAVFADPSVPVMGGTTSGWQLALAAPDAGTDGWAAVASALGVPTLAGTLVAALLVMPLVALAVGGIAMGRNARSLVALALAGLGFVLAVASAHISVQAAGAQAVPIWPGGALSIYWLGLVGAAAFAVDRAGRARSAFALVGALALVALAAPSVASAAVGGRDARASDGLMLPAYVTAEVATRPGLGTLVLEPLDDGSIVARVERGPGTTLDARSVILSTQVASDPGRAQLAELAANITSRSGYDPSEVLSRWGLGFILLDTGARGDGIVTRERARQALGADADLESVGTTRSGLLWHVTDAVQAAPLEPTSAQHTTTTLVRVGLLVTFVITLLVAVPTTRRRRVTTALTEEERATTFDADEPDE